MKKYDQAFPVGYNGHPGMTLRDYFAAKAMQSLILDKHFQNTSVDHPDLMFDLYITLADESYDLADAMLEARKK
jgi:hypothetical protein